MGSPAAHRAAETDRFLRYYKAMAENSAILIAADSVTLTFERRSGPAGAE